MRAVPCLSRCAAVFGEEVIVVEHQANGFQRDQNVVERLHRKYARGGLRISGWRQWLRFIVKKNMWILVLEGSRALKRLIDIIASSLGLLVLSPLFIITACAIKLDSPGPVFYSQQRVGKWGKIFTMYKFRSMRPDADKMKDQLLDQNESGGVTFKMKRDPRITRVGAFIRKFSIDELPQLYNVLRGDISLVGPRPPVPREVDQYTLSDRRRLEVIPGITCIWQVSGRSDIEFERQVALDVQYIESRTFWGDVLILLKTIPAVLSGRGAY
jgi:exopolysaccharide biosynthesis polyprenyl glycosylphosphotransferase